MGTNGNGLKEAVVGGGELSNGSGWTLYDDYPGVENNLYEWAFDLDNSDSGVAFTDVTVYVCRY